VRKQSDAWIVIKIVLAFPNMLVRWNDCHDILKIV